MAAEHHVGPLMLDRGRNADRSPRRILVINPNTNPAVTARIRAVGERIVDFDTTVTAVNPETGPFAVETPEEREAAIPGVLSMIAEGGRQGFDGYVLACFDDIGLQAARGMVDGPVVGTCEAGIAAVRALAGRFSIVTTVVAAVPVIDTLLRRYGARDLCTVRAAGITVAEAATGESDRLAATIRAAIEEDGAEAILLGSGGLTGRAEELAAGLSCPVVDGVAAAIRMTEALVAPGIWFRPTTLETAGPSDP